MTGKNQANHRGKVASRSEKQSAKENVILSFNGKGIFKSWITLRVPTPLALAIITLASAYIITPDTIAHLPPTIVELGRLILQIIK